MRVTPGCTRWVHLCVCVCLSVCLSVWPRKRRQAFLPGERLWSLSESLARQGCGHSEQRARAQAGDGRYISASGVASGRREMPSHCGFTVSQTTGSRHWPPSPAACEPLADEFNILSLSFLICTVAGSAHSPGLT